MSKQYSDLNTIKVDSKSVGEIYYKNNFISLLFCCIGLISLLTLKGLLFKIIGIVLMALSAGAFFLLKDHKVADVYEDFVLIYDESGTRAIRINNTEIDEWKVDSNDPNKVVIRLNNNEMYELNSMHTDKLCDLLLKTLPKKTTAEIVNERLHGSNSLSFTRAVKNLFNKKR